MSVFHDEVEIEDFEFDEETQTYYYPCPCGDQFQISKVLVLAQVRPFRPASISSPSLHLQEDLENGEEVAECPSCSLIIRVIYDPVSALL